MENNEEKNNFKEESKKKKNNTILIIVVSLMVILILSYVYFMVIKQDNSKPKENEIHVNPYAAYRISGNSVEDFDLYFLQLENNKKNKVYSPLSIKYALEMLQEGANGDSKEQIANIIGTYNAKKYINSKNLSLANALFVKDTYKNSIKSSYIDTLSNKYNAEVVYDSFQTPNNINLWVKNKTLNLIDNISNDVSNQDFILINSLAIDMEWRKKIQSEDEGYSVVYAHEDYSTYVDSLRDMGYSELEFNEFSKKANAVKIGAVVNRYDIINKLGEDNIRATVKAEYEKWLENPDGCYDGLDVNTYLNKYIEELDANYQKISSSTDFSFHTDDKVKVFAKDLKEYNGTTLQYVGIMPNNESLENYIKNIKAADINTLLNNLKTIEINNFKNDVITEITGYIPMFKFDYKLDLIRDLNKLGIVDIFDTGKADLSNLTSDNAYINQASHKANIEFSNNGIKAGSTTTLGGLGNDQCGFDYLYDVPVKKIDLTFDKPYLFIIRDKESGEIWFTGTVYEPLEYQELY